MQFNSYIFIFLFLPITLILYFITNKYNKNLGKILLIAVSIIFYIYEDIKNIYVLGASLIINYIFARIIEKKKTNKLTVTIPIVINIFILLYFKYTNFLIININNIFNSNLALKEILLPVGISFFTFQQIAYIIAVQKKEINKISLIEYLIYILYFPKLLMGPLMEPNDFLSQVNDNELKKVDWNNIAYGIKTFSYGLFKKIILADTFAKAVSWGFLNIADATSMDMIIVMLSYTFEIYFDFSGYSDMAVGTSLMFNIKLPINFDSPYKALSIRDFWKRWHISLTKFLTKYIYIPLGGSRKGLVFTCINTMIVFLVSGIWHGANWTFILWGLLHGLLSVIDRLTEKKTNNLFEPFKWIFTFIIINILWLLFRANSVSEWLGILHKILSFGNTSISIGLIDSFAIPEIFALTNLIPLFSKIYCSIRGFDMILFIVSSFIICMLPKNNYKTKEKITFANMFLASFCFVWSVTCLSAESVFVYFNF